VHVTPVSLERAVRAQIEARQRKEIDE
jgi:hypothetical protein